MLRRVLTAYISAFHNVSLTPIFVWDGTFPLDKLETVTSRLQSSVRNSISYMRAGPSLRSNRGFQVETGILPVLAKRACVAILRDLHVEQRFPGGEADPIIAELAVYNNAYILSQDSDFFVTAHGSQGYIPLDSLNFVYNPPEESESMSNGDGVQDGSWAPVKGRSSGRKQRPKATLTLDELGLATEVACMVYQPIAIAVQLGVRVTWLPMVAILAGNDYYVPPIWRAAGSPTGGANSAQRRLDLVAKAIVKCGSKWKEDLSQNTVGPFLASVIDQVREFAMTDGQISNVVARCMEALAQYSLSHLAAPWMPARQILDNALAVFVSAPDEDDYLLKTRLFNAYEHGHFPGQLLQILSTGLYAPLPNLEDPDATSCNISCSRAIRTWVYALLHQAIGISQPIIEGESSVPRHVDTEQDEEALCEVDGPDLDRDAIVREYIRRGATLVAETVEIPTLSKLLLRADFPSANLCSSTIDRFRLFLLATSSLTPRLSDPSAPHLIVLATLASIRHLAFAFQHSKTRAWTNSDRLAALAMALLASRQMVPEIFPAAQSNQSIQRAAQLTSAIHAVTLLAECLLLVPLLLPGGETHFDGRLFAWLLTLTAQELEDLVVEQGVPQSEWLQLVAALEENLPMLEEAEKLSRNERKKRNKASRLQASPAFGSQFNSSTKFAAFTQVA